MNQPKPNFITDTIFNQCLQLVGDEHNQRQLQNYLIDPLVTYFKQRLRFFYVTILILLFVILIVNGVMIFQMVHFKHQVTTLLQPTIVI